MQERPFTLHVRLTKFCNASCHYCSSYQENPSNSMDFFAFKTSLDFIHKHFIPPATTFLSIEYIGGEILLIKPDELTKMVIYARDFFLKRGITVIDGAQSNLISTKSRLRNLKALFGDRIGTSIDSVSDARSFKGSNERYIKLFDIGEQIIESDSTPAVFTIDKSNKDKIINQYESSMTSGRNMVFRHVFSGGSDVELLTAEELSRSYLDLLNNYLFTSTIIVDPIHSMIRKRLNNLHNYEMENVTACPFQADCLQKSLSLEPNGDLYICQELSDYDSEKLGNALEGVIHKDAIRRFSRRQAKLEKECYSCDYFQECQGGCAMESIQFGHGVYGKTEYCSTWKSLFGRIDELLLDHGAKKVTEWMDGLES